MDFVLIILVALLIVSLAHQQWRVLRQKRDLWDKDPFE